MAFSCCSFLQEFKAYPGLVRTLRKDYAGKLGWSKEQHEKAIRVYDDLLAEKDLPTREIVNLLNTKRWLQESLKRYDDANRTTLVLLAQPSLDANRRAKEMLHVIETLSWRQKDHEQAFALTVQLAKSPDFTAEQRVPFALTASYIATGGFHDRSRGIPPLEEMLKEKAITVDQRCDLTINLIDAYCMTPKAKRGDDAIPVARAIYTDKSIPLDKRFRVLNHAMGRRGMVGGKADQKVFEPDALAFLKENEKELTGKQIFELKEQIYRIYRSYDKKSPKLLTLAEGILADTNGTARTRVEAADILAKDARAKNDLTKALEIFRRALPVAHEDARLVGNLVGEIVRITAIDNDLPKALAACNEAYRYNQSEQMTNRVAELIGETYKTFNEPEKAFDVYMKNGNKLKAAELAAVAMRHTDPKRADKLFREIIADEKEPMRARRIAYEKLYDDDAIADKYLDLYTTGNPGQTNMTLRFFLWKVVRESMNSPAFNGQYDKMARHFERYEKLATSGNIPFHFEVVQYAALAYAALGKTDRAAAICKTALAQKNDERKPAESYELAMLADQLPLRGDVPDLEKAVAKADKRHAGDIPAQDRVMRLERTGSAANLSGNENLVRALDAYKTSLYVPAPKTRYVVEFSETPIRNVSDMEALKKQPEIQKMDRAYGGNMDFLVTDVATGNRGTDIGKGDVGADKPTLSIVCDARGIHFRFTVRDERAREIENGLLSAGSFEGYIAPGDNQPYVCFLIRDGKLDFWNTTYDTTDHRRIQPQDLSAYRTETYYTDDTLVCYMMISWDNYATLIPENGTIWNFENILWGRKGKAAWNGTESIHGRSTWGELEFRLTKHQRAQILKPVLFKAMKAYNAEKTTMYDRDGDIAFWKDQALGDLDFYEKSIKPMLDELDAYLPLVKNDMTDEDVFRVADKALPKWRDIRYEIARLRQKWLAEKLME